MILQFPRRNWIALPSTLYWKTKLEQPNMDENNVIFCLAGAQLSNYKSCIDATPTRKYKTAKTWKQKLLLNAIVIKTKTQRIKK